MSDNCPIIVTATGQNFSASQATYTDKNGDVHTLSKRGSDLVVGSLAWLRRHGGRNGGEVAVGEIIYVDLTAADGSVVKAVPLDVWNCKPGTGKTIVPEASHAVEQFTPEERTILGNISLGSLSYGDHDTKGHAARAVWAIQHADGRLLYETISGVGSTASGPVFLKNLTHTALHDPSALADILKEHGALAYLVYKNIDAYKDLVNKDPKALEILRVAVSKYSENLRTQVAELGLEQAEEVMGIIGRYGLGLSAMRSFAELGEVGGSMWGGTREFEAYCRSGAGQDSWTALKRSGLSGDAVEVYGKLLKHAGLDVEQETEVLVPRVLEMTATLTQSGVDSQEAVRYVDAGAETVDELIEAKRRGLSVEDVSLYAASGLTGGENPWWVAFHSEGIGPRAASVFMRADGPGGERFTCEEVLRLHASNVPAEEANQWLRSGYSRSITTIIDLNFTRVLPEEAEALEKSTRERLGKSDVSSEEMRFEHMRQCEEGPYKAVVGHYRLRADAAARLVRYLRDGGVTPEAAEACIRKRPDFDPTELPEIVGVRALEAYTRLHIPVSEAVEYAASGVEPEAADEDYSRRTGRSTQATLNSALERSEGFGERVRVHALSGGGQSRSAEVLGEDGEEVGVPTGLLSSGRIGESVADLSGLNLDQMRIIYREFGVERYETIVELRDLHVTPLDIRTWRTEVPDLPIAMIIAFEQQGETDAFEYLVLGRILKWGGLVPRDSTWEPLTKAILECREAGIGSERLGDLVAELAEGSPRDTGIRVRNVQELLWLARNAEDLPSLASQLKNEGYELTVSGVRAYLTGSKAGKPRRP